MKNIAWFLLICFLPSCYGTHVIENFTPLDRAYCSETPKRVYVFFSGEPIHFKYKRVGALEVVGNLDTDKTDVLERLKLLASKNCANAIIGVQQGNSHREWGVVPDNDPSPYRANTITGLAVQIEEDSTFLANHGNQLASNFEAHVQKQIEEEKQSWGQSFLFGVLIVGVLVLLAVSVDQEQ